jgi:hypothetical protein
MKIDDLEGGESWRALAREVRASVMEYWQHEHEPKSEMRLMRVMRALDRIRDLERQEESK